MVPCKPTGAGARPRARRGAAAVELALTLPLLVAILTGLWEVGRIVEVQQILYNAAREAARQASTGEYTNAQVQQIALSYLKFSLNDTNGAMTAAATVTVSDLTTPGTDASQATTLDELQVSISIPFSSVRWVNLSLVTDASTAVRCSAIWPCLKDAAYPTTTPQPPSG